MEKQIYIHYLEICKSQVVRVKNFLDFGYNFVHLSFKNYLHVLVEMVHFIFLRTCIGQLIAEQIFMSTNMSEMS